jgi:hypothetical protein
MRSVRNNLLTGLLVLAAAAAGVKSVDAAGQKGGPLTAAQQPLPASQVNEIYSGKTWLWPEGAAYFAPGGRFIAWSGKGQKESFATGTWHTAGNGRLCFRAFWVSRAGGGPAETCFAHASKAEFVFQSKQPGGEWYVFKHPAPQSGDEFRKIVGGDRASAEAERIRAVFRRG